MLAHSPSWLFAIPAVLMVTAGATVFLIGISGAIEAGTLELSYRTAILSSTLLLVGLTSAWSFAIARDSVSPEKPSGDSGRILFWLTLGCLLIGTTVLSQQFLSWLLSGFGHQEFGKSTTITILGATLFGVGSIGSLLSMVRGVVRATRQ